MTKNINITAKFASLAAAVAAANVDLSYNPEEAARSIQATDLHCHEAFTTEDGVYYVYDADDGVRCLHKFHPFFSCLDDGPFAVAVVEGDTISITEPLIKKDKAGRAFFRGKKFFAA